MDAYVYTDEHGNRWIGIRYQHGPRGQLKFTGVRYDEEGGCAVSMNEPTEHLQGAFLSITVPVRKNQKRLRG